MQSYTPYNPEKSQDITEVPPIVSRRYSEVDESCRIAQTILAKYVPDTPVNEGPATVEQLKSTAEYVPDTPVNEGPATMEQLPIGGSPEQPATAASNNIDELRATVNEVYGELENV